MLRPYDKLVANLKHGGALLDRARLGEPPGIVERAHRMTSATVLLPQGGYPPRPPARPTTPASARTTAGNDAHLIRHRDESVPFRLSEPGGLEDV